MKYWKLFEEPLQSVEKKKLRKLRLAVKEQRFWVKGHSDVAAQSSTSNVVRK